MCAYDGWPNCAKHPVFLGQYNERLKVIQAGFELI